MNVSTPGVHTGRQTTENKVQEWFSFATLLQQFQYVCLEEG